MVLLGQDGIVGLETVLVEESLVSKNNGTLGQFFCSPLSFLRGSKISPFALDVQKRVLEEQDFVAVVGRHVDGVVTRSIEENW